MAADGPGRALDLDFVRRRFPDAAWRWAFFDNAGGSFVPQSVIDRVTAYMTENQVQPGSPAAPSQLAAERMVAGECLMAEMIGADADEVMIGPSTTANVFFLSRALKPLFGTGDEIVVTSLDHEANNGAWRRLANDGIVIREWTVDPETGVLDPAALDALLSDRTRLVCFPHCSNVTGAIHDAKAIVTKAHAAGALTCVDGVAYAPHRALDVKALGADIYLFSLYKTFGPHLGLMYAKRPIFERASGVNHFFLDGKIPLKLNPGGPNHELTAGLVGIADYIDAVHAHHFPEAQTNLDLNGRAAKVFSLFHPHEVAIGRRFLDWANGRDDIRLIGPAIMDVRAPTFSFVVKGRKSSDLPAKVAADGVAISNGSFYAWRLMQALELDPSDGVVRASMLHYNTLEEVDRLTAALDKALD